MKKTVTTIIAASLMLVCVNAFAQFNIGAAYINSADRYKINSDADADVTYLNGFSVGAGYTIPIVAGLQVTPAVCYSFAARNDVSGIGGLKLSGDTREHYISVPVDLGYSFEINPDFKLFVFAGPTASVGLSSKTKLTAAYKTFAVDDKLDNYDEDYNYRRFDVMLGGGAGVDLFEHFRISARYDCGLVNRYSADGDPVRHRNQLSAGIAYLF